MARHIVETENVYEIIVDHIENFQRFVGGDGAEQRAVPIGSDSLDVP